MFKNCTNCLYFASRVLCSPLEAMYTLLIFILSKELNPSIFQLTLLASTKPVMSIVAFYITSIIVNKPYRIKNYLIVLNVVGCLPCFLFPIVDNIWYYILAYATFVTTLRAAFPAWIEILNINLNLKNIGNAIATGNSINYLVTMLLPCFFSYWMDYNPEIWKSLFVALATVYLLMIFVLIYMRPIACQNSSNSLTSHSLILPLKEYWKILKAKNGFSQYLIMFFVGGAGLVMIQPILPIFFKENLELSYQELTLPFSLCKGIAFVLTASLWARWANRISLYLLNYYINIFSCLFIVFMLASTENSNWLILAFAMYGTMQAGCELSWSLSGPIFSQQQDSALYSGSNLLFVGIRGCLFPFVGQFIFLYSNASYVFMVAGCLCLLGVLYAIFLDRQHHIKFFPLKRSS